MDKKIFTYPFVSLQHHRPEKIRCGDKKKPLFCVYVNYMCTVSVCVCVRVSICVSFYMSVTWDHVVDSYSLDLYDVMCVSLKHSLLCTAATEGGRRFPAVLPHIKTREKRAREKKKLILKHSFQMLCMQHVCFWIETRKHQMSNVNFLFVLESPGNRT